MTLTRRAALLAALLPATAMAADQDAAAPIQALDQALQSNMQAGRSTPFPQRFDKMAPVVERAFDLPFILQESVGLRWKSLPADQQQALLDTFRKFTVAQYVANFDQNKGDRLEILPDNRILGADQVVATRIVPQSGEPTRIDYVMRRTPTGWRAIDVLLNGSISQVAVNRSDWRSSLATGAGPLVDNLRSKVQSLSGGALN